MSANADLVAVTVVDDRMSLSTNISALAIARAALISEMPADDTSQDR